jgi:predicted GNAT superfamily acetyltransferase
LGRLPISIRECRTIEDFDACIALQREAFYLPDLEISPRRHFVVSQRAGGWTLGAFVGESDGAEKMVGFVHHLVALRDEREVIGYSHMMAIATEHQNQGVGVQLKWAQRERARAAGVRYIKWTWDPMQARNAHFNLNRLGVIVRSYGVNFYGVDYPHESEQESGIESDRLFAEWELDSARVWALARGDGVQTLGRAEARVEIPTRWRELIAADARAARDELRRVRNEFAAAFADGLICGGFERDPVRPKYLFFRAAK